MTSIGEITRDDKIRISNKFLLQAPPGEFNEVFNDVRVLLNDDDILKSSASTAVSQYNREQFTSCVLPDSKYAVIISKHNEVTPGRFLDPRTKQSFHFDHLKRQASDIQPASVDQTTEPWRAALETTLSAYLEEHYGSADGAMSVFSAGLEGSSITLVACFESHQFQPKNFWNGRWRSQWTISFDPSATGKPAEVSAFLKVQVHYYEDGNVQLVSSKDVSESVNYSNPDSLAKELQRVISAAETDYEMALSSNYQTMSDETFKALRRILPVTKTKIDWAKLSAYKIGSELSKAVTSP